MEKFLPDVLRFCQDENRRVWVVDNASTDDSVAYLKEKMPEVGLVQLPKNHGFAGGYNLGLKEIESDYYFILNSDVEIDSDCLSPLLERLEAHPEIAACQPKIRAQTEKEYFEYAGASGGFLDHHGFPFCRGRIFESRERDAGQYDLPTKVFWATGAALFIRSSLFHQTGGFDADFFAHMEEIDLCWRLQNAGYEIWVEPKSVVYHVGGATLNKSNPRKTYLNFRNNLKMMLKNLPASQAFHRIILRMVIDGQAAIKELLSGNSAVFFAILRAHFHFYRQMPNTIAKRTKITNKKKMGELQGLFNGSIVWWYYARGIKEFNKLPLRFKSN